MPVDALAGYAQEYIYSSTGNRITQTDPDSGGIVTNTYDVSNRLLTSTETAGVTTYTYDANGNQLTVEEPSGDKGTYLCMTRATILRSTDLKSWEKVFQTEKNGLDRSIWLRDIGFGYESRKKTP